MHKLIYNKTILLFLNIDDMVSLGRNDLREIKNNQLTEYDNCIIFNYYDLLNHKPLIKDRINKLKFINQTKINARECVIINLDKEQKNNFLNENHIQGTDKSQLSYGALHNNQLIAVMTFDISKGMNGGIEDGVFDLSRFSIKSGYVITGIFNKILKRFIDEHNPKKIISFADLNLVNKSNNIYEHYGFKISKHIQPDFKIYHSKNDKLYHKFTYGRKYFKNENISESEKEETKKYLHRVWNCGKLKYELLIDNNRVVYGYIYMIRNKIDNKKYIGQTARNFNKRIYEYKSAYNCNSFNNEYLGAAFNTYGWDNFEFKIIDTAFTVDELNQKEIEYIKIFKSNDINFGYNIESGGKNAIPTQETLNKMSIAHSNSKQNDEWVNRRIAKAGTEEAKKYGRPKTEEDRLYLSQNSPKYWLGKERDEETRKKISETKKLKGPSQKQKDAYFKKVYKKNAITRETIKIYESTGDASKYEGVNQSTISRWCKDNKVKDNILWTYNK